ncbi:MAG: hypothetical protein OXD46_12605 [Chloroflexi bacterium]|nr:hypothetical protein [Chloroflexota bacterium]
MKEIRYIQFIFVAAVLVVAMACGQNADPAAASKEAESAATQALVDPVDEAEAPGDTPDIADYMDAETARLFEQMTPEWQESAKDTWVDFTKFAPREDWTGIAQSIVPKEYAQAKIQGGLRGVPVAGVQDLVDPSKGAT